MTKKPPSGTQSVLRAVQLMKIVAERREIGWRLTDLAAQCGLDKSTTFRIVACLTSQRIFRQRPVDRRYVAGPLLYELSLAVPAHTSFKDTVHPHLQELARHVKGLAFLYLLAGNEVICIDRAGATHPQPLTGIGTRRPILQSTFGISMLLTMPKAQQRALQAADAQAAAKRPAGYKRIFARSRRYGFGVNIDDIVPALTTVAVALRDQDGMPFASLGVMAPTVEVPEPRIKVLAKALYEHAKRIEEGQAALIKELHSHG